ncbi:MAG: DinB family protein [Fimbriimonadaceae bacterium]|nr:DinB family protein [Fimbriimonadaceae bacterium]QYK55537.1 MAG: DinB family protein [Fimbriimonadaceae bacterium]
MTPTEALLESWTRQSKILANITTLLTPELLEAKPSEDGWTVAFHLAHLHSTRRYWHMNAAGLEKPYGPSLYTVTGDEWIPSHDLDEIRERLAESEGLVHDWVATKIMEGAQQVGNYDHPVLYLQHMIWHEGWHCGLIFLALRLAGHEPTEEWECENVWDLWRLPD